MSRHFHIQRGVKQGDPLSSLLFNALLEDVFRVLKRRWTQRQLGVQLGHTNATLLTNLRFADDVLLFATTLPQLTTMLNDLHDIAGRCGLELHPDKTVILSNLSTRRGRQAPKSVEVGGRNVQVLPYTDTTKYLGRKLTFNDHHAVEIDNRLATAWRKFNALRDELTNKRYSLHARLRLFHTTITPTALYGSSSWTTTKLLTTKLQRAQRRMLRLIVGTPRRRIDASTDATNEQTTTTEPWPTYIKRATAIAERQLHNLNIESWPTTFWRRKWQWAHHIATQHHTRWGYQAICWKPQHTDKRQTRRRQGHPYKRWDDDITNFIHNIPEFANDYWLQLAQDPTSWNALENDFIRFTTTTNISTATAASAPTTTNMITSVICNKQYI